MKRDVIVDGEAMAEIEGHTDVTHLIGATVVIDMQAEPQRRAFQAYKVAFNVNATDPNLKHAAALVHARNAFADIMEIERV
ncbi:hypothetical protein N8D56_04885 [Devosia sp. A8/3-2]|nr:hypothetical protein N8D56_04885 [Devosia sp. A8/3-2]